MPYRINAFSGDLDVVDLSSTGGVSQINTDAGSVTPAVGVINLNGTAAQGISSSGAGNTVTLTIADATETQKGVSELATSVETVIGSDSTRTIVSSGLTAKLGTQTANSVPYGAGTTNALSWTNTLTDGQLIIGSTAGNPQASSLSSTNSSVTITPGSNTINLASYFPITLYVVDGSGNADYTTIQSAMDAANTAGGPAAVYVRPKATSYTEDLTFYNGIDVWGAVGVADTETCKIVGKHTPPASGTLTIRNIFLESATHIFDSAVAGTAALILIDCAVDVTNGYTFNLPNWTGSFTGFDIGEIQSTNDGWVNNTAGATVFMVNITMGAGTGNTMIVSGPCELYNVHCQCPIRFQSTSVTTANGGCWFSSTVATTDTASLKLDNSLIRTTAQALTHNSSTAISLSNVTIDTSAATAIGGSGVGAMKLNGVDFLDSDVIAGTLTIDEDTYTHTGEIVAYNIQRQTFTGFYAWTGAGNYYSVAGTTFTLLRGGYGYIDGRKVTWSGGQNTGALTKGNTYLVYIDSTGTIGTTTSFTQADYEDNIPLFEVFCDNDTPSNVLVVKENHPYSAPTDLSVYLHNSIGTVISNRNNGANVTLNGTDEIEISGTDYLEDHGLETTIPDSGGVGETWEFYYTDGTGKWVQYASTATFPSIYNNAGTPTALGASKYGVFRLYCAKEDLNTSTPKYIAVIDDAQYNNLTQADTAIANGNIVYATNELFLLEVCHLGYVIYEQSTSSITEVIIEKATIRGSLIAASASTANLISTTTTNFNGWLSAADTNVQSALDTLDDVGLGVTPEHSVLLAGASYALTSTGVLTDGQLVIGNTGNAPSIASLTQPAAGITITGGAGTITFALSDDLAGIEALATTGLVSRTAANTYAATTITQHAIIIGGASEVPAMLGPLTDGQIVIGSTGNAPVASTLTAGTGTSITNAAGSITINSIGGGLTWSVETGATNMVANHGYIGNNAAGVTFTLPGTSSVGDVFRVTGLQASWTIAQNAGQTIYFGNQATTTGAGGSLASTNARDVVELVCVVANNDFQVISSIGNITVT